ncbi:GW domain-containing glycosaminoglycan-binding protein [Ectobacillus sp. sgz5001026]|uniref:GW domain-containing glycosaminoglycan-binding protein n=1 Tax=Ectobacillus sp. sgz5001026 TaxID=3242473 RepID=UPI0036D3C1D5
MTTNSNLPKKEDEIHMKKWVAIIAAIVTIGLCADPAVSIHAANTQEQAITISINALIGNKSGDGIWTRPYGEANAAYKGDVSLYAGTIVHATSSLTYGSTTWYFIQIDGKDIGWVDHHVLQENIPSVSQISEKQIMAKTNGNAIWSAPYGMEGAKYIGSTNEYTGKDVQLTQQLTYHNVVWDQISINGKVIGWVDRRALSNLSEIKTIDNQSAVLGETHGNGIWTMPYGVPGAEFIDVTSKYAYSDILLLESAKIGSVTWYKVVVDWKIGWVDARALDNTNAITPANMDIVIGANPDNGIWSTPYGIEGAQYIDSTKKLALQQVTVTSIVQRGNVNWYQIRNKDSLTFIGWIDGDHAVSYLNDLREENRIGTVTYTSKGDGVWSLPYGEYGARYLGPTNNYANQAVQIVQSIKGGETVWYHIRKDNQDIGWVDSRLFSTLDNVKDENRQAVLGSVESWEAIYKAPEGEPGDDILGWVSEYNYQSVQVLKSANKGDTIWNQIQLKNGLIGWVNSRVLSKEYNGLENIKDENYDAVVQYSPNGDGIWSAPYGEYAAEYYAPTNYYSNQTVHVIQSAKKGATTWIKFKFANEVIGWVDERVLHAQSSGSTNGSVYTAPEIRDKALNLGFFTSPIGALVYNKYGIQGNILYEYASLFPTGGGDIDINLMLYNTDPDFEVKVKDLLSAILPTQGENFFNMVAQDNSSRTFTLDGRTIKLTKYLWGLDISFGPIKN